MTIDIDIRVLGPLEVDVDGAPCVVRSGKQRAVLTLLALASPAAVRADALADALWGAAPPSSAHHALHVHVSGLRRALGAAGGVLETRPGGYGLAIPDAALDARRFEAAVEAGRAAVEDDPRTASATLRDALALWRGPACADVGDQPGAMPEVARLEDLRQVAHEARIEADLALGRHADVIGELHELTRENPFRERLWYLLILALYRSGRASDALAAAREMRAALDELGLVPTPELRELERSVLLHDPALAVGEAPAAGARTLPAAATSFVGRDAEVERLAGMLVDPAVRLVTVRGSGGIGKTRLAVEVASAVRDAFPGGVIFVPLATLRDPALVLPTVAQRMGIPDRSALLPFAAIAREVAGRPTLLVLDNAEHLLDAAPIVADVLAGVEALTVLVTSRAALRLRGEHDFVLNPLALPPRGAGAEPQVTDPAPAVTLFAERARVVRPEFELSVETAELAAEVCRRVDGLPLAIELAAARMRVLPLTELCRRLERPLDLLTGGARDLPSRQQTLRATLEWSEQLLSDEARALLARLAVFAGEFELDAVEDVCGNGPAPVLGALEELVENSLVLRHGDSAGRFAMLETIREHAEERLEERERSRLRDRQATWALRVAESALAELSGDRRPSVVERLALELPNVRAALTWLEERGRWDELARLASALEVCWHMTGHALEGMRWLDRALQRPELAAQSRARALASAARLAVERGDLERAAPLAEEAVRLARSLDLPDALAAGLMALSGAAYYEGRYEDMRLLIGEAEPLLAALGDRWQATFAGFALGAAALSEERDAEADELLTEAASGYALLGDDWGLAATETNLAALRLAQGRHAEAAHLAESALDRFERLGDRSWIVAAVGMLSEAVVPADLHRAELLSRRAVELALATDQPIWLPSSLLTLSDIAVARGCPDVAARLLGASQASRRSIGLGLPERDSRHVDETLAGLRDALGDQKLGRLLREGEALEAAEAVALLGPR